MALFFADLVREYSSSAGSGDFVLDGAVPGHRRFADAVPAGALFHYAAAGVAHPEQWEVGEGEIGAGGTLLRTPIASSAGGAAVDFSAGLKTVTLTVGAAWFAVQEAGGDMDATLAALAGLDGAPGALEQTGPDSFAKRSIGASEAASLLTRGDGDERYLLAAGYTAADVLAKVRQADGAGSGLDADLLDGMEAAAFARLSGAAFSGTVTVGGSLSAAGNAALRNLRVEGTGSGFSGTGVGVEMFQAGGTAYQSAYNRSTNSYAPFAIIGSTILFQASGATVGSIGSGGMSIAENVSVGGDYRVAGTRVVGPRITGWSAPSGAASRAGFDTASANAQQLAERLKALIDDLTTHGLIG